MNRELRYLIAAVSVSGFALAPLDLHGFPLDPRLRFVALGFAALWIGIRLGLFIKAWERWQDWRRSPGWSFEAARLPFEGARGSLPDGLAWILYRLSQREWLKRRGWGDRFYPDKGIFLGRGFPWSPEHTQELETHLQGGSPLPTARDMRGGYPALHAVGMTKERPLVLPWSELVGHVLIGGTTRSGKTRLLEVILSEVIRGPGTVIVMDPKGDAELLMRAASEAFRMNRQLAFFSPAFPKHSSTINPFSTCETTTELAARVQALMPGGGGMSKSDPFFTEYPLAIVERLATAQKAVGQRWTIEGLNAVTTLVPPFEDLIARYLHRRVFKRRGEPPDLAGLMEEYGLRDRSERDLLADALIDDYEKPRDHYVQVTANLVPAFRGVTGGKIGPLLSSTEPQLTWDSIVEERKVVYLSMNSLMFGEVSNRIGRVILQDLIGFLGRRYAFGDPDKMTPITILIDEFSNVAYPGFIDALNKGGGARANFMLAMQSLADPEAAMGKDGTQRVLDNLNTRVWFRLTDDATAKLATEGLGLTSVSREDVTHSLSFGGDSSESGGSRGGLQYADRPLVRPEWVTGLPRGEAFVRTRGENWKLRVPLLAPLGEKELREVADAYGLGRVLLDFEGTSTADSSVEEEAESDVRSGRRRDGVLAASLAARERSSQQSGQSTEAGTKVNGGQTGTPAPAAASCSARRLAAATKALAGEAGDGPAK